MTSTKRASILVMLCTILCTALTWAQQSEPVRNLKIELKSGEVVKYNTDQIEKIFFNEEIEKEDVTITVDEIGRTSFKFSISTEGKEYIFAVVETGEINFYGDENISGESYLLAMTGHIGSESAQYEWVDGATYEIEDIRVKPGRNYTILAALWHGQGQEPDKIYRKDFTTEADPQSQSTVDIELTDITSSSVTVKATPANNVSSYIVFVKDKAWTDMVIDSYGEAVLQSTVERAAETGMAYSYTDPSMEVHRRLDSATDYCCLVVLTDNEGNKKLQIHDFRTLD